ncbi:MAG TPA: DNA-3-methyladenine glycosylase 2 family protein [Acidimicrobiales bacterium]|nr:DNA-3-methyladenine glycosylase 2 family protein [Acidimicrobiales bacterium]
MYSDFDRCYRAVQSKDPRFDGWFVTAVLTTRIYCRPSCPARPPHARNMRFYPTAASAQQAGFRACKRCRPDASPGSPEWNSRADVVARAMRLIGDGVVDREGVGGLARHLGYSVRQLERYLLAEVGAGPLGLARAQRAQTARLLIETTSLPFGHVAFAAGFSSIRQFNDTVRLVFALTPTSLRGRARSSPSAAPQGALALRLPFRQPLSVDNLFGHLIATATPGVEEFRHGAYRRTLRLAHGTGIVSLTPQPDHVACRLVLDDLRDLTAAMARCRRLLDLDADPEAVDAALKLDPVLRDLVRKSPGRRIPRTVDEDEFAVRAVLGQQVSTGAARTHAGRLAASHGTRVVDREGDLTVTFPSVDDLAVLGPDIARVPASRNRTLRALTDALASNAIDLRPGADWDRARASLRSLPGIGDWTVEMIALRSLGDPDAFPAGDLGVRRAAAAIGAGTTPSVLREHAQRWRPWRGYAVQYLWATHDHPINNWPPKGQV